MIPKLNAEALSNDVRYTKEKEAITIILGNFAQALNNGDTKVIPDFFDLYAIFIPDGMKRIIAGNQLRKTAVDI